MSIPNLTEAVVREHTEDGSFERGVRYFEDGAVQQIDREPGRWEALVKGSKPNPYVVDVEYGDDGIREVRCTCPYHQGSWCKHLVAVFLAVLRGNGDAEEPLATLFDDCSREELVALVEHLAEDESVRARVEAWMEGQASS